MKVIKKVSMTFLLMIAGICFVMLSKTDSAKAAGGVKIDEAHFSDDMIYIIKMYEFDINKDGFLSSSEINKAKIIEYDMGDVKGYYRADFRGINYLTALEKIDIDNVQISNFNIYELPKLKYLRCSDCKFKKEGIKFDRLKHIEELLLLYTDIKYKGDFRYNTRLKALSVINANVNKIALKKLKNLESFGYGGDLKKINLTKNKKLKELHLLGSMKKFDLKKNKALRTVYIISDVCTSIDISGFDKLNSIEIDAPLTDINVTNNASLRHLKIKGANLTSIDLNGSERLRNYNVDSPLESIDFSRLENLVRMDLANVKITNLAFDNQSIRILALKNCNDVLTVDASLLSNLKSLYVEESAVSKIKFSDKNVELKKVHLFQCNNLSEIEIGDCNRLKMIGYIATNEKSPIRKLTALKYLSLANTNISVFNCAHPTLSNLLIKNCDITEIDVSNLPGLGSVTVSDTNLKYFIASENNDILDDIEFSKCKELMKVEIKKINKMKYVGYDYKGNEDRDIEKNIEEVWNSQTGQIDIMEKQTYLRIYCSLQCDSFPKYDD